jgi:hypothetical protein
VCTSCGRACRACAEAAKAGQPLPHTIRAPWCVWCTEIYSENAPAEDGRVYCQNPECPHAGTPFPGLAQLIEQGVPRYPAYCKTCRSDGRRAARLSREGSDTEKSVEDRGVLGEDGGEEAALAREEAAEFRANDATVGADAVVAGAATAEPPAPRTYRTRAVRAAEAADASDPSGLGEAGGGGTGLGEEGGGGTERKPRGPLRPTADGPVEHEGRWSRGGFRPRLPGPDRTDSEHGDGATVWPGNR